MLVQTQTGPIYVAGSISPVAPVPVRTGNLGDLVESDVHGRYYETSYRKNLFYSASTGINNSPGNASTGYSGLCLSNAPGNPVNIVLQKVGFSYTLAFQNPVFIGLMT